jgi:hypothetical protein
MTYKYPNVILDLTVLPRYPSFLRPDGTVLDLVVREHMAQLLDALAVKYPLWVFHLADASKVDLKSIEVTKLDVYNDANPRENIGSIGITTRYNRNGQYEQIYAIGNRRIAMSRDRGAKVETKHLKVAIKAVDKFFTPAPWDERLDATYDTGVSMIQFAEAEARRQLRQSEAQMHDILNKFVTDNWDMFLEGLDPKQLVIAEERVELHRSHKQMSTLQMHAHSRINMLTVIIEGGNYVVQSADGTNSYTSEQLTDEVRMKIGMLKLTDEREVLPDIGVKTHAGYLIMLDPQPEGA